MFFKLQIGIDYIGGSVLEFQSLDANKIETTKSILDDLNFKGYQIKEAGRDRVIVRLFELSKDDYNRLSSLLSEKLPDYAEIKYDNIGPTIGSSLRNRSIWAVVLASLGIIVYIAYAFRKVPKPFSSWKFGTCAVLALIHDLLITVGFVSILGHFFSWMEVDTLFITAMLTIMGFSVHDTIVVYDRLRENFIKNPHQKIEVVAQESINQTLIRSINTSLTTVLVLISILIFGSESIRHFVITMTFGFVIGTYSSIFIATPILIYWHKNTLDKKLIK